MTTGSLRRAIKAMRGEWYGPDWWPAMVLACMGYIMVSAAVRA
jgi:hypothetical protein